MEENKSLYGNDPDGKLFTISDKTLYINDKFVLATLIAIITTLEMANPNISDAISAMAETIYEHIKEGTDTSELGQTGTDTGATTAGSESEETA